MKKSRKPRSAKHAKVQREGKELDRFQCAVCWRVTEKAHGHHIVAYADGGPASVSNIVTLCDRCHVEYHAGRLPVQFVR